MTIDELLIRIGVDASQASRINDIINQLNAGASRIGAEANEINRSLNGAANDVASSTERANNGISKLKLGMIALTAAVAVAARGLVSVFNSAIDSTADLYLSRGALFNISQNELEQARQYKLAMDKSGLAIDSIKNKIALNLAPEVTKLVGAFNKWMIVNKDLIANGITKIIQVVGKVIQVFVNLFRFFDKLISNTIGWKNAIIALGIVWAIFNRALLFSPIGIVIGLITALMLLVDDLMVYMEGGKSLFGEYWQPLIDGAKLAWKVVKLFWSLIKAIWLGDTEKIKKYGKDLFDAYVQYFSNLFDGIKSLLSSIFKNILVFFGMSESEASKVVDRIGKIFNFITNLVILPFKLAYDAIVAVMDMLGINAGDVVNAICAVFKTVFDVLVYPFKAAYDLIMGLFDVWEDDTSSFINKITDSFSLVSRAIIAPFKAGADWVKTQFLGSIESAINKVKGWLSYVGIDFDDNESVDEFNKKFSAESANAVTQSSINSSNKVINQGSTTNNITVNTSDTKVAADQIGNTFARQLENAKNNSVTAWGV